MGYRFFLCVALVLVISLPINAQPQDVPRLSERPLDKASYVQLAKEWKDYIEKNGETSDALVNLGMAYDYSGEEEAALLAAKRAYKLDSDNPRALEFLAKMLAVYRGDEDRAIELLKHCREVAPDYKYGLIMLAAVYLRRGELKNADDVLKTIFEQRVICQPLQDYAYNMLVGLPEGAILITNGDNDTFPPLALQVGMNFRRDVAVINRNLLNLKAYAEAIFKRYPSIKPLGVLKPEKGQILSNTIIERLARDHRDKLYIAASVDLNWGRKGIKLELPFQLAVEGMNRCSPDNYLSAEESAHLFLYRYRLDSATDWNFAWDLTPGVSNMMQNYVVCMIKTAEQDDILPDTKRRLLDLALEIARFHNMSNAEQKIKLMLEQ